MRYSTHVVDSNARMTALSSVAEALAMKVSIMRLLEDVRHDEDVDVRRDIHMFEGAT